MSIRNLQSLFQPKSVAVFGASIKPHSVGETVMRNLLEGGFNGPILPVNPKYTAVAGVLAYPTTASLPITPDLAVLCTPPATVPGLVAELGARGTKAAIVITAGLDRTTESTGGTLQEAMLAAARPHLMRILGPNCVGLMVPGVGLNASFAHVHPLPGKIAFITQSGALSTAVLDWARSAGIGLSHFISIGNSADVDFGDLLDYLGGDPSTRAILLYIESIKDARKFMSAARAAARNKPVLAVKSGRVAEGARAAASHTGAMTGADDVFDAAIRRAGMLRVNTIEELFDAVETLARAKPARGPRLTILTNGGGPGVMATDALIQGGGQLAALFPETLRQLDRVLPENWSHGNPVDIIGDAPVQRYLDALKILQTDPATDAVLFIHAPTAIVPSLDIAQAVAPQAAQTNTPVVGCWLGRDGIASARRAFANAGLPTYDTPEDAVNAFLQMVNYHKNQVALMETPPSIPEEFRPNVAAARSVVQHALEEQREWLTEPEAKEVLNAYQIPTVETRVVTDPHQAERAATQLGFPVALKILSPDITHKSDVGGVALDLETAQAVREAGEGMIQRLKQVNPQARLLGFTVQKMARRPGAHELIVGTSCDPIFGPVILFGQGGTAVEVIRDRAVTLAPLNLILARDLISRTRVSRLLAGYRNRPAADLPSIEVTLVQIAQIMADLPEVEELDINPLLADQNGVLALDARIRVKPAACPGTERLSIRPYPKDLEEHIEFAGEQLLLRPIRPEDEPHHLEFFRELKPEDIRFRFFGGVREMPHTELARYTQIDYAREMAFIATAKDQEGKPHTYGVVRAVADPDFTEADFAIVVRSDMKGKGLGRVLLEKMIRYCRNRGLKTLVGQTLSNNERMIALAKKLGFQVLSPDDAEQLDLRLDLQSRS